MWDAGAVKERIAINTVGAVAFHQLSSEIRGIKSEKPARQLIPKNIFFPRKV